MVITLAFIVTNPDDLAQDSPHLDPQSPEPSVITDGSTSQLMDASMAGDDPDNSLVHLTAVILRIQFQVY